MASEQETDRYYSNKNPQLLEPARGPYARSNPQLNKSRV